VVQLELPGSVRPVNAEIIFYMLLSWAILAVCCWLVWDIYKDITRDDE
jgi:hypothetical protein